MDKQNLLDVCQIKKKLPEDFLALNIYLYDEVTSTNTLAKEYAQAKKELPALFIARKQTHGRGRQGRSFYSQLEYGLYFTLVISPEEIAMQDFSIYTLLIGATLARTIEEVFDLSVKIKWVNDLFLHGKKVSGILSESVWDTEKNKIGALILGVGINLAGNFSESNQETRTVAGTLFEKLPKNIDLNKFFQCFLLNFSQLQKTLANRSFLSLYEERLLGLGKNVKYMQDGKNKEGVIIGLNKNGNLLVELANGKIDTLLGQEIHFSSTQFL